MNEITDRPNDTIAIMLSNPIINGEPCVICGVSQAKAKDFDLFTVETTGRVCWACGRKYCQALVEFLEQRNGKDITQGEEESQGNGHQPKKRKRKKHAQICVKAITEMDATGFYDGDCDTCGEKIADFTGVYGLFNASTNKAICWDCGKQIDPELVRPLIQRRADQDRLKKSLLADYDSPGKDPMKLFQIDVWRQLSTDSPFTPDQDGFVVSTSIVHELRRSSIPLRVHLRESADLEDVLKGLDRAKKVVQEALDKSEDLFKEHHLQGIGYEGDIPF